MTYLLTQTILNLKKTNSDETKANILAEYFSSVFKDEPKGEIPSLNDSLVIDEWTEIIVTEEDIKKILRNLKTDKSPGMDKIHPLFLKELSHEISIPLAIIYRQSLILEKVPTE